MNATTAARHADNLAGLSSHAFQYAAVAAFRRLAVLGWTQDEIHADRHGIAARVNDATAAAFPSAMDDARQAIEAGMNDAANQTFAASFVLAGIAAADAHHAATRPEAAAVA
jgi:hypothetical protein